MLHLLRPGQSDQESARSILNDEELARAARFRFAPDADAWIAWRAGLRRALASYVEVDPENVPIRLGESEKPVLDSPFRSLHFNLSHARDLAAVIVSGDGPVGIDVEPLDRATALSEVREEFCHAKEIRDLPADPSTRERALLGIWVAKEALLKALGSGLAVPPRQLWLDGVRGRSEPVIPGLLALKLATPVDLPTHLLATAVPLSVDRFDIIDH